MYVSFPAAVTGSSPGCALHFWLGVTLNGMFPSFQLGALFMTGLGSGASIRYAEGVARGGVINLLGGLRLNPKVHLAHKIASNLMRHI
ncbi:hypothetical protein ACVA51_20645 [Pseudomonas luteola]